MYLFIFPYEIKWLQIMNLWMCQKFMIRLHVCIVYAKDNREETINWKGKNNFIMKYKPNEMLPNIIMNAWLRYNLLHKIHKCHKCWLYANTDWFDGENFG